MTEATTHQDSPADQVEFVAYHRPGLESGTYRITVKQVVKGPGIPESASESTFETTQGFTVAGDRFTLKPADIYAVFPPENSLGEHSLALPHVALTRSTLPWEQDADDQHTPWLALLLFYEHESLGGTIKQQEFLDAYADAKAIDAWDYLLTSTVGWLRPLDTGRKKALIVAKGSRAAQALDGDFAAAAGRIEAILDRFRSPQVVELGELKAGSAGALRWPGLSYDPKLNTDTDQVTVIDVEKRRLATVMPTTPELNLLAHVRRPAGASGQAEELAVIIGNRLPEEGGISNVHLVSVEGRYKDGGFDFGDAGDDEYFRLISLKSWRFACVDPAGDFTGLLKGLDREPSTLRLPRNQDAEVELYLAPGQVPAPHSLRAGGRAVSWYRGPLITHASAGKLVLPAESAADLVRHDADLAMLDVSYAAAWELGRLLALQSKQISVSLYNWKRANAQRLRQTESRLLHPSWTAGGSTLESGQLPDEIAAWFDDLRKLRGVPFNYLVPDERMLPPESIRFFQVDHAWIDCLLDGAFSIGRVTGRLKDADHQQKETFDHSLGAAETMSGFLLRSSVVAGWPGLLADAKGGANDPPGEAALPLMRMDRLSPNVLLCLFAGEVQTVEIHQRPETLHFGFKKREDAPQKGDDGVVDIAKLANTSATSATFASSMIEGVPKIIFTRRDMV